MLTYRTGAAGAPASARAMAEHVLRQTLAPEMAVLAEFYEQGVTRPTPAEAAFSRYSHRAVEGLLPGGRALEGLVKAEAVRLAESALAPDGSALAAGELQLEIPRRAGSSRRRSTVPARRAITAVPPQPRAETCTLHLRAASASTRTAD
jgi:hypothetical protein